MLGLGKSAISAVDLKDLHQIFSALFLCFHGIMAIEEAIVDGLGVADLFDQRNDGGAKLVKEYVQHLHGNAFLVFVQQRIVGGELGIIVAREFAVEGNDLFEIGREGGKIVVVLRFFPDGLRLVQKHFVFRVFVLRNTGELGAGLFHELGFSVFFKGKL